MNHQELYDFMKPYNNLYCSSINPYHILPYKNAKGKFDVRIQIEYMSTTMEMSYITETLDSLFTGIEVKKSCLDQTYSVMLDQYQFQIILDRITELDIPVLITNIFYFNTTLEAYNSTRKYFMDDLGLDITKVRFSLSDDIQEDSYYVGISLDDSRCHGFLALMSAYAECFEIYHKSVGSGSIYYAKNITKGFVNKFNLIKYSYDVKINTLIIGSGFFRQFEV